MTLTERIQDLHTLGDRLAAFLAEDSAGTDASRLNEVLKKAEIRNPWFDEAMVRKALSAFLPWLDKQKLGDWMKAYELGNLQPKKVGIIMAGNVPAVGFHDLLCVLIAGHRAMVKLSSDDAVLIPWLMSLLFEINPAWESRIQFHEQKLGPADAVIATGSNNSSRYFEYYFRNIPTLIRKSRSSAAILTAKESSQWLEILGADIFTYYGMGCRSVSKLFVPQGYDFKPFFEAIFPYQIVTQNRRYLNNYEYYRAYYLMNLEPLLDNHFLLLKKDEGWASPPAVLFYEYYDHLQQVSEKLESNRESIQCLIADAGLIPSALPPGSSQNPSLLDYADGVDTMNFLCSLG
jgi:hypothetical protein